MFIERCEGDFAKSKWTIYPGFKAIAQILLVYKKHYKYVMNSNDILRIEIRDENNTAIIMKKFTFADVEKKSRKIIMILNEEETKQLVPENKYYFAAFFNEFVTIPAQLITVRKVVQ